MLMPHSQWRQATTQSLLSVFGLLFDDTLAQMGQGTTGAAVLLNAMVAITNFSGLCVGPLMKCFSYRQVALAGGMLVALGMLATSGAAGLWHLFVSYSILVGLGLGLINPSTFVAVNAYFTRTRGRAVGLSLAGTGLGQMLMPHAVSFLLDEYGFRGAVLVLSAVALHSLPGAALFHPLRWHARPAPPPAPPAPDPGGGDSDALLPPAPPPSPAQPPPAPLAGPDTWPATPQRTGGGGDVPLPVRRPAPAAAELPPDEKAPEEKAASAGRKTAPAQSRCRSRWRRVVRVLDLDLLADPSMASLLIGLAAVYTAGVNFNMLFPFFLSAGGLARSQVAACMSLQAGFDISSRLIVPALTDRARVPARTTFLAGALALAAARSLMAMQRSLAGLMATAALCGFIRGSTTVNLNLAISESCSTDKLPGALGINMALKGLSILLLGLLIGWLRDLTGSFTLCMHVLSLVIAVPMLVWLVEVAVSRRRRRPRR